MGAAILQGLVLFRRFPRAWQWILVSVIGWLAGVALTLVVIPPGLGFLSGAVLGIAAGTAQWLMLRSQVHWAGWWILVSALAWGTGRAAGLSVLPRVVLAGAMAGITTGIVLELLLLHPKRVDLQERQSDGEGPGS